LQLRVREFSELLPNDMGAQTNMTIATNAGTSQVLPLQVVAAQPKIFAVLNSDRSVNLSSNPSRRPPP
jgi:hypothetical protein